MPWKQTAAKHVSPAAKAGAKRLRRNLTDAEKLLWRDLRGDFAGAGTHFRRQVPIGPYVADFCCLGHRLIIELDGPIHDMGSVRIRDAEREGYLRSQGFRLLRFRNEQVMLQRHLVLETIKAALGAPTPTPSPSPQGGGEPLGPHP